jgi:hypothetical protein
LLLADLEWGKPPSCYQWHLTLAKQKYLAQSSRLK